MNNKTNIIDRKAISFFSIAVFAFCLIFVFITNSVYTYPTDIALFLNRIFLQGIIGGQMFSIFELIVIALSLSLINKYHISLKNSLRTEKFIFVFLIVSILFKYINPNNITSASFLGIPLYGVTTDFIHIVFLSALFFTINVNQLFAVLRKIAVTIVIMMLLRAGVLLVLVALGRGLTVEIWKNVTTLEGDTLYIASLVQVIFLYLFLIYSRKKYLIMTSLLLLFLILSFRRGPLFVSLFSSLLIILTYIFYFKKGKKYLMLIVLLSLTVYINLGSINSNQVIMKYFYRNFGAFVGFKNINKEVSVYAENRHIEQSIYGLTESIKRNGFWGYGKNVDYSATFSWMSSSGIHNAFVQVWITQGLIPFLFYISIVAIVFFELVRTIVGFKKNDRRYSLLKFSIVIYLLMFFMLLFFGFTIHELINSKPTVYRVILLTIILKVTSENYHLLLPRKLLNNY